MLNLTRLWCGASTPGDNLRYGEAPRGDGPPPQPRVHHRPVVVWNISRLCNLHCAHCYISATTVPDPAELDTETAFGVADQLASYSIPVLLLSGGEPMARPDILQVARHATAGGLRVGLSTNGTLLTTGVVKQLKKAGVAYVGISIDGPEAVNDKFRGSLGAFSQALAGIRNARAEGFRVSLRFTLTRYNHEYLGEVFDLVEREGIPRVCIYHLAYAGRGARISERADLSPEETRAAIDLCLERTEYLHQKGLDTEVLTVDNHSDAAYLALRLAKERPQQAEEVLPLLSLNGGNASGIGIGSIGPHGDVHADQFSHHRSFGSVVERPFSVIWEDTSHPIMAGLKAKPRPLEGRCAVCPALSLCNGNLRVRAETATGNMWAPDPACYLTDRELQTVGGVLRGI
ncbi:MAG: putative heme d1 biosynthesis radical protein NirJ1 [Dehalococcoidia bacterium]|nr:putative heme d1 biosynthesis radical protein NirJ1 [Dehalococcoidia bacterium]